MNNKDKIEELWDEIWHKRDKVKELNYEINQLHDEINRLAEEDENGTNVENVTG